MVFLGGAVLANLVCIDLFLQSISLSKQSNILTFHQIADKDDMWVSKQEWQEQGARALAKLGPR